jgi:hypothetical protein
MSARHFSHSRPFGRRGARAARHYVRSGTNGVRNSIEVKNARDSMRQCDVHEPSPCRIALLRRMCSKRQSKRIAT